MSDQLTKASVAATIRANIARMSAALATNEPAAKVYCWNDYGLGVTFKGSECGVVSIERATIVRKPDGRTFKNGANVPAVLMSRDVALQAAIANARALLPAFA